MEAGRELDKLVAEIMGGVFETFAGRYGMYDAGGRPMEIPDYSTDHNAVALVRAEIARRGLQDAFVRALVARRLGNDMFALINADPAQQCVAALKAVGVEVP